MSLKKLYSKSINSLYRPEDDEQTRELKKNFFLFTLLVIPPVIALTILTYLMNVPVLQLYGWMLLIYYTISLTLFFILKNFTVLFYYFNAIYVMALTTSIVIQQGGIPYSGGILYSSLAIAVFAFIFNNTRLAVTTIVFYIFSVVILFFLQPMLEPAPEMIKGRVNDIFTLLNSVWLSLYILAVIFYVFDRRANEERKKRQKLKELDDLKSKLFTNITHEFRTPLTIILGAAEGDLSNQSFPFEGRGGRRDLIKNNAHKLLRLVNQMLNLSKLETGNLPLKYVQTDVIPFISFLIESRRSFAEQKQVKMNFLCDRDQLLMDIDADKLEDIILNLLHNAIKFTPYGGEVIVSLIVIDKNGQNVQIKIKDSGIGIPEDKLDKIFDRFYQVDENAPEGSGIGLTLTKEYVQILGGKLTIQSKLNKGSTFSVTLPIKNEAQLFPFEELIKTTNKGSIEPSVSYDLLMKVQNLDDEKLPLILIVEDNKEMAYFLSSILIPFFRVESAFNGQEGVQKAFEIVPDLIISDVMMPLIDGFELCDRLKNDFKTNHIPIILLTAKVDADSRLTGLKKGADDYLAKPFNTEELLIRIKNLIEIREKLKQKYSQIQTGELNEAEAFTGLDKLFMDELNRLLEQHYTNEDFGIEEACADMKVSRVQLHRKLVALTGISTSHFINNFRLDKAANLLHSGRKTIAEIAYETGFSDPNYFSKIFKKKYGKSAQDFRARS